MDNDTLRRGRPTAHVVYGEGMAILSGDGLLTEAFALLAREPRDRRTSPRELARASCSAIAVIADAAGAAGMVGGQAIDLAGRRPGRGTARQRSACAPCTRERPARSSAARRSPAR